MINILKDLLFPRRCAVCDDILRLGKKYVCEKCRPRLELIRDPFCMKCGKRILEDEEYCSDCKTKKHLYKMGRSALEYGSIAGSMYRFKNKGRQEYAEFYARILYSLRKDFLKSIKPDFLVPVPIHSSKLKARGYNQSELISRELSKLVGIPTNSTLIKRIKNTKALKNLSLKERQNHLKSAFKVVDNDVKLKTIVIIDDIYTTGSTIDEMCRAIYEVYNCNIYFLTVTIGRGI